MKVAVIGASGMAGSSIAAELVARGHEVTAVTSSGTQVEGAASSVAGDFTQPGVVRSLAEGNGALVFAVPPSRTGGPHEPFLEGVANVLAEAGSARVVWVGGAGSLEIGDGQVLADAPGFPDAYKPEADTQLKALDAFRAAPSDLDWTFVSPSPVFAPGEAEGGFVLGTDAPVADEVSSGNFARAIADELEHPLHSRRRFTVGNAA